MHAGERSAGLKMFFMSQLFISLAITVLYVAFGSPVDPALITVDQSMVRSTTTGMYSSSSPESTRVLSTNFRARSYWNRQGRYLLIGTYN